mmetsp:Transcript_59994/g.176033  ORF Transcript_59994/g.176033 Transcript_59994/m.176033 type:complete len:212 (+) Transcript_59994:535-1170(+)
MADRASTGPPAAAASSGALGNSTSWPGRLPTCEEPGEPSVSIGSCIIDAGAHSSLGGRHSVNLRSSISAMPSDSMRRARRIQSWRSSPFACWSTGHIGGVSSVGKQGGGAPRALSSSSRLLVLLPSCFHLGLSGWTSVVIWRSRAVVWRFMASLSPGPGCRLRLSAGGGPPPPIMLPSFVFSSWWLRISSRRRLFRVVMYFRRSTTSLTVA